MEATLTDKDRAATEIVKKYALYSAGAGLIPLPLVDFAAIAGVELKMLQDLGDLYDVPFKQDMVRPIVASILGGYTSQKIGAGVGASMLKAVPLVGQAVGMVSTSAFGAAITWAIGKVFIQHFASGGTFLDFDPDKVRAYFGKSKTVAA
jgi:uncharacterized protein (DUF697 family)